MTTNATTAINDMLEGFRTTLEGQVSRYIERNFARMAEMAVEAETGNWKRVDAWIKPEVQAMWRETTRDCCDFIADRPYGSVGRYELNAAKVAKVASEAATATIKQWEAKLVAKLADLEGGEAVRTVGSMGFMIKGRKGDAHIGVEQTMIVNYSSKGKLFNQFPARIYVDGKFTSEAAYKRMFG